mgnify:CR=1 FL=1
MLDEARKRDTAANALLGLAFAANAASSPEALIKSGNIEGPGFQLMSRMMRKRKEADRNLDSERVSKGSRNRKVKQEQKMKTFNQFLGEFHLLEMRKEDKMYEGYDKPDERLKTDRDMFNVPKDEQDAAKARLLAKAKKMREKKKLKEGNEAKSCPDGKYWCFTDEKCKKIPTGYVVGRGGYLSKEEDPDDEVEINDMGEVGGLGEENIQEALPLLAPAAGLALKGLGAGLAAWSAKDAYDSAKKGDWGNAALSGLGAIPGVGLLGRGARGAKALRGAQAATRASQGAKALNRARQGTNAATKTAKTAGRTNAATRATSKANKAGKTKTKITGVKRNILGNLAQNALDRMKNNSSSSSSKSRKYGVAAKDFEAPGSRDARERYRKLIAKKKQEGQPVEENYKEMIDEKCWKGYEKKGMKVMFGKKYPNCVKKKSK